MTNDPANLTAAPPPGLTPLPSKWLLAAEPVAALLGTVLLLIFLLLTALNAGPLWRDEVNTINLAQMRSLAEFWRNLPFESFPPLWPLLLRGADSLGLAGSDASIRMLGFGVGLLFSATLWLSARWLGCRAPILSLALLGGLPAFVFIVGSNRAYGLACCLLVLSFGLLWRLLEQPSRWRMVLAGLACLLFVQCVYYDVVLLAAMLAGAALVALRRRQGPTLAALVGIGGVSAASLVVYLPIVRQGAVYVPLMQWPYPMLPTLWFRLGDALTARSSGAIGRNGPEIWLWIALLAGGTLVAMAILTAEIWKAESRKRQSPDPGTHDGAVGAAGRSRADLMLFCVTSLLLGTLGMLAFLYRLHYCTQPWYYVEMLCLCAVCLDGLLGASCPSLYPWGLLRIGFLVALLSWGARAAWTEAHTRRTDVDLIAAAITRQAVAGDFIVVQGAWEGITFNRYYHGPVPWETVPPVNSHWVHRNDQILARMQEPEAMAPVLRAITNALQSGHSVWLVGNPTTARPQPPPTDPLHKWGGRFELYWSAQVSAQLLDHALHQEPVALPTNGPVCGLENLPLFRFAGNKGPVPEFLD